MASYFNALRFGFSRYGLRVSHLSPRCAGLTMQNFKNNQTQSNFLMTLSSTSIRNYSGGFSSASPAELEHPISDEKVKIVFIDDQGVEVEAYGKEGQSVMEVGKENGVILGNCKGSNCVTCHIYVHSRYFHLFEEATSTEFDAVLEAPFSRANCSRLACQVRIRKEIEGAYFGMPSEDPSFFIDWP